MIEPSTAIWELMKICSSSHQVHVRSIFKSRQKGFWLDFDWTWYGENLYFESKSGGKYSTFSMFLSVGINR